MSGSEPFVVEELTGPRRRVTLTGYALPHQGVAWGGTMRIGKRWYQGSTVASASVFGPTEKDTEVRGEWHAMRMAFEDTTSIEGFPELGAGVVFAPSAEKLRDAFDTVRRGGQLLRVAWSGVVRHGFLVDTSFPHKRREDIEWALTFSWVSQGEAQPPVAMRGSVDAPRRRNAVQSLLDDLHGAAARVTTSAAAVSRFSFAMRARVAAALADVDAAAEALKAALAASASLARIPSLTAFQVSTLALDVAIQVREFSGELRARSVDADVAGEGEVGRVAARADVADATRAALDLEEEVRRIALLFARLARPLALAVVIGREGEDLRAIARRYYGSSDLWQLIADRNGLDGSRLRGGEVLIVPERA